MSLADAHVRLTNLQRQRTTFQGGPTYLGVENEAPLSRSPAIDAGDGHIRLSKLQRPRTTFVPRPAGVSEAEDPIGMRRKANSLDEPRPPAAKTESSTSLFARRKTWTNTKCLTASALKPRPEILDDYKPIREIGKGAYGVVYAVEERFPTSKKPRVFACKILDIQSKSEDSKAGLQNVLNEVELMMASTGHPNLQDLVDFALADNQVVIISSMCYGGDLAKAVESRGCLSEVQARGAMAGIFRGLSHLHAQGIVHRDLKLENVLIAEKGDFSSVKIIDYGFAKQLCGASSEAMNTVCGTPMYIAPELIARDPKTGRIEDRAEYGTKIDMWACGVVMYSLLSGSPPFSATGKTSIYQVFNDIREGKYNFTDDPVWASVSETAKDLIASLLTVDPKKRIAAKSALRHPWLLDEDA